MVCAAIEGHIDVNAFAALRSVSDFKRGPGISLSLFFFFFFVLVHIALLRVDAAARLFPG